MPIQPPKVNYRLMVQADSGAIHTATLTTAAEALQDVSAQMAKGRTVWVEDQLGYEISREQLKRLASLGR